MVAHNLFELDEENLDAYDDLIVSIQAKEHGLSLLISVCDDLNLREQIIAQYEAELQAEFHPYRVTLVKDEPSLRAAVAQLVESEEYLRQGGKAVITVMGAERLYFLKLGEERSEQEIFFGYLQWTREALREFPFAIVLWVTNQMLVNLIKKAPDFWSWRNGVFRFVSKKRNAVSSNELEPISFAFADSELTGFDDENPYFLPIEDLKQLIQQTEQQRGKKDPSLATLYSRLAETYKSRLDRGEFQDYKTELDLAIEYLRKAVELQKELGLEQDLATSLNTLARTKTFNMPNEKSRKAKPTATRYENIPFSGVVEFVGRETELQKLHQMLQQNQQVAIAAITGMSGVGKTELALQYAIQYRDNYQGGICWLSALQDVGLQLVQFARNQLQLNPPEDLDLVAKVQYCLTKWHEGKVLLVIDNVTNYREEVRLYLESVPSRFKQLITTREKLQPPIVRLDLDVLTPLAAMQLLKSIIGEERLQREVLIAEKLCQWLGYLPLGLELVGRYLLGDKDLSLVRMLQNLENERLQHEALDEVPQEMVVKLGVAATFELSWRRLRENAQRLGCLLSLFALAPIPWELVEGITINNEAKDWKKARRDLLQLHLLESKGEGIYQLHPLLREFFQVKLTGLEQAEEFKRSVCRVMVAVAKDIPQNPTLEQITYFTPAIPHIAEVANNLIQYVSNDDLVWPFIGNALFYNGQGLYDKAAPWLEQCLEVTKKVLGEENPSVAISLNNLAYLYNSQGRYSEAEPLYLQALLLTRRLLGEEHPSVATSLNNLAGLYKSQGRYSEAESLYLQSLSLRRRLLGEEHPDVATSLNNLAGLYKSQGRYSEAEPLYVQSLSLRRRLLGEEHPDVATSFNNLAGLYKSQGRYSEAEPLYLQALLLTRRLLGEEHPSVAISLNNLAGLYKSQGKYNEAEPLYVQSLSLRWRLLGEEHPDVATSLNNLAGLYKSQGRYSEAEPLYVKALDICERQLGKNHPDTITVRENLADLRDRLASEK